MKRLQYSLFAAAGILILAFVLTAIGPKRVMAALGYTTVRDVDNPGRQPFSDSILVYRSSPVQRAVSPNKRLVITWVDATTAIPGADDITIVTTVGGSSSYLGVPFSATSSTGRRYAAQQVSGYADPGTTFYVYYDTTSNAANNFVFVNIHGYYVDVP